VAHSPFIFRLYKLDRLLKKTILSECKRCVGSFNTDAKSTGFLFILFNYIALHSDVFTSALYLCCEQGYFGVKQLIFLFRVIVSRCFPITRGAFCTYISGLTLWTLLFVTNRPLNGSLRRSQFDELCGLRQTAVLWATCEFWFLLYFYKNKLTFCSTCKGYPMLHITTIHFHV